MQDSKLVALRTVALVTGAAWRIGRQIALDLARAGADVAVHHHRSAQEAEELVEELRGLGRKATAIQADLTDPASWPRVVDQTVRDLGGLTVLVNNASEYEPMDLDGFGWEHWDRTFRLNLTAVMGLAHYARPHLERGQPGRIVNLCDSLTGPAGPPRRGYLAYGASKAALHWLTRALARELAPNILVNGVAPGVAVFPDSLDDAARERILSKVPLGNPGGAASVSSAVRFLVQEGHYVTGHVLVVDGGLGLG